LYKYQTYTINIHSEVKIPQLLVGTSSSPNLVIAIGETPKRLEGGKILSKVLHQISPSGEFLIELYGVCKLCFDGLSKVTIEPSANPDWSQITDYIISRLLGMFAHSRNWIPLHASAVSVDNEAVLFLGGSGTGKSLTAASFIERGHRLISDNLVFIDSEWNVLPSYPFIKLWGKDFARIPSSKLLLREQPIRTNLEKYHFFSKKVETNATLKIKRIYLLSPNLTQGISIEKLNLYRSLKLLSQNVAFEDFLTKKDNPHASFMLIQNLVSNSPIHLLKYQLKNTSLGNRIDLLEANLNS
jgi:hypothetical protein